MVQFFGGDCRSVLHYTLKQRNHDSCGSRAGDVPRVRVLLFKHMPFIVRHLANERWLQTNAVVGKYSEGSSLFVECEIGSPQRAAIRRVARRTP